MTTTCPDSLRVDPDGGTGIEREAARVIRTAVADFERETLSLSAVDHLLRRLGNVADVLDRSDVAPVEAPQSIEPQSLRVQSPCQRCGGPVNMTGHPRYCAVCDDVLNGGHRVMS